MPLSALEAHLACAALVLTDLGARTLRVRTILRACRQRLSLRQLLTITLTCDAACAVTPFRLGGEPARVATMLRAGVPLRTAVVAIASETVQTWPVIALCGLVLGGLYGGGWWDSWAAGFRTLLAHARLLSVLALATMLLAAGLGLVALRLLRRARVPQTSAPRFRWPRISTRQLLATVPLTIVAVAARVLVLPVLGQTLAGGPGFGETAMASFTLLHSQLLLPSPAGAGAVDLGLFAHAQGGAPAYGLLLAWRFYTTGLGLALGALAAALTYGPTLARRRWRRSVDPEDRALLGAKADSLVTLARRFVAPQLERLQDALGVCAEGGEQARVAQAPVATDDGLEGDFALVADGPPVVAPDGRDREELLREASEATGEHALFRMRLEPLVRNRAGTDARLRRELDAAPGEEALRRLEHAIDLFAERRKRRTRIEA
jgi:uncharacterized membrane protein YbhN (UPF0104 family)